MFKNKKSKQNEDLCLRFQTLPTFAQQLISYIHYKTGAAAEIILTVLLGVMAFSCQDKFDVQLKNGKTFTSLYLLTLAKSGSRKSTVFKMLMEPIYQLEKKLKNDFLVQEKLYLLKLASWETESKELKKQFSKAIRQQINITEAYNTLEECLRRKPIKPVHKRLIINDTTIEGLKKELTLRSPSLMLSSDEAGGLFFDSNLFRNSSSLNSLWGEGRIADSRASRDSYDVDDVRFSILLLLQPDLFNESQHKLGKNARNSGYSARLSLIDLEQCPELISIPDYESWPDISVLDNFFSIITKHLQDGINRREKNNNRICITFSEDADEAWKRQSKIIRQLMKRGGTLQNYDDFGARIMEQTSRIAGVIQMFITPDSPIITEETFKSASQISQWLLNHSITKIEATREPTDAEKLMRYFDENIINNGSYDFRRNHIIKKGPYSVRCSEKLNPALDKLENDGMVQLFQSGGVNYIKVIGSTISPLKLAEALGVPIADSGSITMNKLPRVE
ncbi:YfjI family protein [Citrobacter freundii]|uniref:YfjI family protein n=1 Tax=Citrobacter freundii TaxID=546 RepID=UPI001F14B195|nr:DUF3987 domain-containing protein [Citrobacter freundii]